MIMVESVESPPDNTTSNGEKAVLEESHPKPDEPVQSTFSEIIRASSNNVLDFLSSASNETLGACLCGLGAATYIVLGRLGLVIIGAVGGVVIHATWDGSRGVDDVSKEVLRNRKKESGIDVVRRILEWQRDKKDDGSDIVDSADEPNVQSDTTFTTFELETSQALQSLTDAVVENYVSYWYTPILPLDREFPSISRQVFAKFVLSFASNLSRKRPADSFLEFATNSCSISIVFFSELSRAFAGSPNSGALEAVSTYLQNKPQGSLANLLDREEQERKLTVLSNDILAKYLGHEIYNCPPARVFLRQILANVVLEKTIQQCSQKEWINEWIVYLLEKGEPELLNAIDAGVERTAAQQTEVERSTENKHVGQRFDAPFEQERRVLKHQKSPGQAEEALEEAKREAQRLTDLMAEEDAKRIKGTELEYATKSSQDGASDSTTTLDIQTPNSSESELAKSGQIISSEVNEQSEDTTQSFTNQTLNGQSAAFTSFDQLGASQAPTALVDESEGRLNSALTLHKAKISMFDDSLPGEKRVMKGKPSIDFMIQVEPSPSTFPGWMIVRSYIDFENLHEVLRRISNISGSVSFTKAHSQLPHWKGVTKSQLTHDLEQYLLDAVEFEALAESEGMKRFLEKERGMTKSPGNKSNFWSSSQKGFEEVGKGVYGVLSKAPKGVAGGGKAVIGGVTSVFSSASANTKRASGATTASNRESMISESASPRQSLVIGNTERHEQEHAESSLGTSTLTHNPAEALHDPQVTTDGEPESHLEFDKEEASSVGERQDDQPKTSLSSPLDPHLKLPPTPSNIADDYFASTPDHTTALEINKTGSTDPAEDGKLPSPISTTGQEIKHPKRHQRHVNKTPINEQETSVIIELLFATITELYTLSSVWNIRRTLLNAAKSYLLRPGNPQLENIRVLLQESVIDANTSDAGIALHINTLRKNVMPTEEEAKEFPAELSEEEKVSLQKKARKLLVEKGMPQALMSVMGASATGEALGKVFDCLQEERIARGLIFGVMLQAIKAATQ